MIFYFQQGWSDTFANQSSYKEHFWEQHQKDQEEKHKSSEKLKEIRGKKKWFGDWMETEQYKSRLKTRVDKQRVQ